jgi:hypothetical protein
VAKILIAGMTSPQSSRRLNSKSMSFSGAVERILEKNGHRVDWVNVGINSTRKDVDVYDVVILGVAPALSVTSNKAYGVLSMLDLMWDDERLKLIVDTPTPSSITANLRAVRRDSSRLFSEFYYARKQYEDVVLNLKAKSRVLSAVERMSEDKWPTTLYPTTPWTDSSLIAGKLPSGAKEAVTGVCVDSYFLSETAPAPSGVVTRNWAVDTKSTKWAQSAISSLRYPHELMKVRRTPDDEAVSNMIASSFGALISPNNDGTISWSTRWFQSMNVGTPIASDWKLTSTIGKSWSHLAAGIEEMSMIDRYELSLSQMIEYSDVIQSKDEVLNTLQTKLGIQNERVIQ